MTEAKKTRKPGRPKLPKGESKGKIVPIRLDVDDLELATAAAKASNAALSEWIRNALRSAGSAAEEQMFQRTLHDAMCIALSSNPGCTATTSELAEQIKQQGLYSRRDGRSAKANQLNARARKYPALFERVDAGLIRLRETATA